MAQGQRACSGEDRFSELPDMLRLQILSLLPRKEAVRTGILSTKWSKLWMKRFSYPTVLNFGRMCQNDEDQAEIANEIELNMSEHSDKKIEIFNLYFNPGNQYKEMTSKWVQRALVNGVEELYLDFSQGRLGPNPSGRLLGRMGKFKLKEDVFESNNTPTILSLSYCNLPRSFKFRYFTSLETLYLHGVNLNNEMFANLISNCDRIKDLQLRECMPLHQIKVRPSHRCLKKVTIANCPYVGDIVIAAPFLQSLQFYGEIPNYMVLCEDTPSLRSVVMISSISEYVQTPSDMAFLYLRLEHVQVLTLCSSGLRFISWTTAFICKKVAELQLLVKTMSNSGLTDIFSFFRQCQFPVVERLFIELPTALFDPSISNAEETPQQIFKHLKIVKIDNFKGHANEIRLLDYLLRAAINLEELFLVLPDGMRTCEADFLMQLLRPRVSPNVHMQVVYNNQDVEIIMPIHHNVTPGFRARQPQIGPRT